ncbi:MAG: hypothetical protein M0P31_19230 [Solirubrobacteraceae bacterium]|nr:hypothetical protein [Solirubrobacteraceae bacterium]
MTRAPDDLDQPEKPPQDFAVVLSALERGLFARQCSDEMAELSQAVMDAGKSGRLTIQLDLKPSRTRETVEITADVRTKAPRPEREPSTFFWHRGELSRLHPNQIGLDEAIQTNNRREDRDR